MGGVDKSDFIEAERRLDYLVATGRSDYLEPEGRAVSTIVQYNRLDDSGQRYGTKIQFHKTETISTMKILNILCKNIFQVEEIFILIFQKELKKGKMEKDTMTKIQ